MWARPCPEASTPRPNSGFFSPKTRILRSLIFKVGLLTPLRSYELHPMTDFLVASRCRGTPLAMSGFNKQHTECRDARGGKTIAEANTSAQVAIGGIPEVP